MAAESSELPQSPPISSPPKPIEGSDRDAALANSEWLSRREVIERRSRRAKQLARVYRHHYWAIMEDLKSKHREYYWTYGKSPFKDDEERPNNNNVNGKQPLGLGLSAGTSSNGNGVGGDDIRRCCMACKSKAMPLTKFCHLHIVNDPNQKLYKGCTCVMKSLQNGPVFCGKPILRTTVPSLCQSHYQKHEKYLLRDLRKAGLNISSLTNLAPKFHVLVSEYVNQIQSKRRAVRKTIVCKVEPK